MENRVTMKLLRQGMAMLAGLAVLLLTISLLTPQTARAQSSSGVGSSSDAAGNSVSSYLSSKGYSIVDVGYVTDSKGNVDRSNVGVIMRLYSPTFDPTSQHAYEDENNIQQAVEGFYALHTYYPKSASLFSALEIGNYWLVFPAQASDFQRAIEGKLSGDDLWKGVSSNFFILDKTSGTEVSEKEFAKSSAGSKDFGDKSGGTTPTLPTDNTPPQSDQHSAGNGYLRLQSSSAFVSADDTTKLTLVATISDKDYRPAPKQKIVFTAQTTGSDEQALGDEQTSGDGAARGQLTLGQAVKELRVKAKADAGNDVQIDSPASVVVLVDKPARSIEGTKQQIAEGLALQGYNVQQVDYVEQKSIQGENAAQGAVYMDMVSKSFDQNLRAEMLSGWGTLMTAYPSLKSGLCALLYPQKGKLYVIVYSLSRSDWQAWLDGKKSEADLWKAVSLLSVIDGKTGEAVSGDKDFVDKNFNSGSSSAGFTQQRTIESRIVNEKWNSRQVYDDNIVVPLGGYADNFKLLSGDGPWGIYSVNDPTKPLYSSQSSTLASLKLPSGNYILVALGNAGQAVKLSYQEHLSR